MPLINLNEGRFNIKPDPASYGKSYVKRVSSDFADLWRKRKLTDITIWCSDGQVAVHKIVLAKASKFLQSILDSATDIIIPDVTCEMMDSVARLLYYGQVTVDARIKAEITSVYEILGLQVIFLVW